MKPERWLKRAVIGASYLARGLRVGDNAHGRILMYHRVEEVKGDRLAVSPEQFRRQMEWLRRREIRVVDLDTLVESLQHPNPAKGVRQAAIKFDDGYEDNHRFAWPILRSFGFTATLFAPAALIGTDSPIPAERPGAAPARLMSWDQLKELVREGLVVGSHGMTHRRLTRLSLAQVKGEVVESKQVLEEKLGRPVDWFCYPGGAFTIDVVRLTQWAGYQGALSVRPGANTAQTHRFMLRRTEISGTDTLRDFELKMAGAYDLWHKGVQTLQRWRRRRKQKTERPYVHPS